MANDRVVDPHGATPRETMVCGRITVAAAITTGSMLAWGIELWAPRPNNSICMLPVTVTVLA